MKKIKYYEMIDSDGAGTGKCFENENDAKKAFENDGTLQLCFYYNNDLKIKRHEIYIFENYQEYEDDIKKTKIDEALSKLTEEDKILLGLKK